MRIKPITYKTACEYVDAYHRHRNAPQGCKWCEYPAHNSTGYACKLFDRCVKWDWFCADGERKDGAE